MGVDERAFEAVLKVDSREQPTLPNSFRGQSLRHIVEAYEAAKTNEPTELNQSIHMSLKVAMALTKKYLFMVGEQKIGNREITELRETHYQVENALDELEKLPKRESVSLEVAAQALWKEYRETGFHGATPWDELPPDIRGKQRRLARTCAIAWRIPTTETENQPA